MLIRTSLFALLCIISQLATALSIDNPELRDAVSDFVTAVEMGSPAAIAKHIDFPLKRQDPIPPIKNAQDFVQRFDEVFDDDFKARLIESTLEQDWAQVGSNGVMFNQGELWLGYSGKVIAINYQTEKEAVLYTQLVKRRKDTLHPSLREFAEPVWTWKNKNYLIRIDKMADGSYRYASWKAGASQSSKPDLILKNGQVNVLGTSRNTEWIFNNGAYRYVFEHNHVYSNDGFSTVLWVYRHNKVILKDTNAFKRVY